MALELAQLFHEIDQAADSLAQQRLAFDRLAAEAIARISQFSDRQEFIKEKIKKAEASLGGAWRGASPLNEPIDSAFPPPAGINPANHIIAADGSQIYPDRHGIAQYALINVGAIHIRPGSGQPPEQITFPKLLYGDKLRIGEDAEPMQAADVNRERDKQELGRLIRMSVKQKNVTVALMDSPLLLWILGEPGQRSNLVTWFVDQLLTAEKAGVLLAGYVDRPGSRGVADLLALIALPDDTIKPGNAALHKFREMPDRTIFRRLLAPGQRSALFVSSSPFNPILRSHGKGLEIAFFYLNVGAPGDPVIACVETPCWVAFDESRLGQLHTTIWEQCQAPGRYPYALARAHELAVVNQDLRGELENLLAGAMLARGLTPQVSAKSFLKSLTIG